MMSASSGDRTISFLNIPASNSQTAHVNVQRIVRNVPTIIINFITNIMITIIFYDSDYYYDYDNNYYSTGLFKAEAKLRQCKH